MLFLPIVNETGMRLMEFALEAQEEVAEILLVLRSYVLVVSNVFPSLNNASLPHALNIDALVAVVVEEETNNVELTKCTKAVAALPAGKTHVRTLALGPRRLVLLIAVRAANAKRVSNDTTANVLITVTCLVAPTRRTKAFLWRLF